MMATIMINFEVPFGLDFNITGPMQSLDTSKLQDLVLLENHVTIIM